jgi:hypothetical protein
MVGEIAVAMGLENGEARDHDQPDNHQSDDAEQLSEIPPLPEQLVDNNSEASEQLAANGLQFLNPEQLFDNGQRLDDPGQMSDNSSQQTGDTNKQQLFKISFQLSEDVDQQSKGHGESTEQKFQISPQLLACKNQLPDDSSQLRQEAQELNIQQEELVLKSEQLCGDVIVPTASWYTQNGGEDDIAASEEDEDHVYRRQSGIIINQLLNFLVWGGGRGARLELAFQAILSILQCSVADQGNPGSDFFILDPGLTRSWIRIRIKEFK